jgi:hypothetical protein
MLTSILMIVDDSTNRGKKRVFRDGTVFYGGASSSSGYRRSYGRHFNNP